ncbi:MAG TPA: cysteine hydrolase [Candidatus Binatus sp.]|nr:cysteine hydrolase [Candidatus Binatus sp.]
MAHQDPRVAYPVDPVTTALVSIDIQVGFGRNAWVHVPHADPAVRNFVRAANAWREIGGKVIHVHSVYTPERGPTGRMSDFVPDVGRALAKDSSAAKFYEDVVKEGDLLVVKTTFSAVVSSDLLAQLRARDFNTAVVAGLTTPICVQTTVDGLSMAGIKVVLLEDACASQPIGRFSAEQAHELAVDRMGLLFAQVEATDDFIDRAREASRRQRAAN